MTETPYGYQRLLQESYSQDHKTLQPRLGSFAIKKSWGFKDVLKQIRIHANYMYFMDYLLGSFYTRPYAAFVNSQQILDCVTDKHITIHVRLHKEM